MSNQVQQQNNQVEQPKKAVDNYGAFNNIMNSFLKMQDQQTIMAPANYSITNAIKTAYLELQGVVDKNKKPALDVCTAESINQALLEMVIKGLNPAKKQCYFVVHGNKLTLMVSYQGTITQMKRIKGVQDVKAYPVYDCDEFDLSFDILTGTQKLAKYQPNIKERGSSKLVGAFAVVINDDGELDQTEYMTMEQVRAAWAMGSAGGSSKAHKNFQDEMAMKSVVNRLSKRYLNNSDDLELFEDMRNESEFVSEVEDNANAEELSFDKEDEIEAPAQETQPVEQEEVIERIPEEDAEIIEEPERLQGQMSVEEVAVMDKPPF